MPLQLHSEISTISNLAQSTHFPLIVSLVAPFSYGRAKLYFLSLSIDLEYLDAIRTYFSRFDKIG